MKILVLNYLFDASAKQITFTDYNPIIVERVLLITNITDNVIIYNFADPTKGGTAATNVLTLTYNTTTMDDTDKLQIFYDDLYLDGLTEALYELIERLAPLASVITNIGGTSLRITPLASVSTAVTGPITSANSIAEKNIGGVSYDVRVAQENLTAIHSNINNVEYV